MNNIAIKILEAKITKLERKIARQYKQFEQLKPDEELTSHGHWSKGYLQGKISVLEDLLDELNEELEEG